MKNLKFLLLLFVLGMSACKKKEAVIDSKVVIIGKWQLQSYIEIKYKNGVKQDETTRQGGGIVIEFKNDKDVVFDNTNYTYQIDGNTRVKLTGIGETIPEFDFEITKISNNELNLFLDRSKTNNNGDVTRTTDQLFLTK